MDGEPVRLAGAALNTDGCRKAWASSAPPSANTEGQPIGRSVSLGKRSGGSPLRIETAAFLQYGESTGQGAGAASKTDGTIGLRFEFSALRQILSTTDVLAIRE
jgi:hypothetical protein